MTACSFIRGQQHSHTCQPNLMIKDTGLWIT